MVNNLTEDYITEMIQRVINNAIAAEHNWQQGEFNKLSKLNSPGADEPGELKIP